MATTQEPLLSERTLLDLVRRRWALIVMPAVVLAIAAGVISAVRAPTYTAQARVSVGQLNLNTASLGGFVAGATGLSAAYSRAVSSDPVIRPVASQEGLRPQQVLDRVSGSPITDSPLFLIEATGPSAGSAERVANATAQSLVRYVARLNAQSAAVRDTRQRYQAASARVNRLKLAAGQATARYNRNPSAANKDALIAAGSAVDLANAEQAGQAKLLGSALESQTASGLLQVLAPANSATSDSGTVTAILILVGLVGGLLIGLGLAVVSSYNERQKPGNWPSPQVAPTATDGHGPGQPPPVPDQQLVR